MSKVLLATQKRKEITEGLPIPMPNISQDRHNEKHSCNAPKTVPKVERHDLLTSNGGFHSRIINVFIKFASGKKLNDVDNLIL